MDKVEISLKQLQTTRHDLKNHLIIIDGYAKEGNVTQISNYIQKIASDVEQSDTIVTRSITISSLLNAKQQICSRLNILFKYEFQFDTVYIDDYSIVTILGNIMDNAITAAKLDNGFILLKIFQLDSQLNICCENNHREDVIEKNGHFISSRNDSDAIHGLGIQSIKNAVTELNGTINIDYSDSHFCVDILVPNYV
jgi:sensor histidine kinase regulating citrate/malate metabolism